MLKVESVEPGSYAAELGLLSGDRLLSMNGYEISDLVDYHLYLESSSLTLGVIRDDDELWEFELEKDPSEDLGLTMQHPHPRQCGNQCLFCFVHQLPKGMRQSLYIKDEDYRFSYLYGSYITLTNLEEYDFKRIIQDQLSPLYISVHATEQTLREKLLGTKIPDILPLLERLTSAGIELHCQIVVCPGINDGSALQQTVEDLAGFYPQIASLAVVPVGLTQFRTKLPQLRKMTQSDAAACLDVVFLLQKRFLREHKSRFVFPADEFYLQADVPIPPMDEYEGFPQIENGVGMIAQFRNQTSEVIEEAQALQIDKITLVTGCSFADELRSFADLLGEKVEIELQVIEIHNDFFGSDVSVTGLITGQDLLVQLQGGNLGSGILIPDVRRKDGETLFLDGSSMEDISTQLKVPVVAVESTPWGILDGLEQLADGAVEICRM